MKKWLWLGLLILCLIPMDARAVDYSIQAYRMTVDVRSDGSADVVETLEYRFDDDYNGILSSFDVGDVEGLTDLKLYVDGTQEILPVNRLDEVPFTYEMARDGKLLNVRAYAPGSKGRRTFRYTYRLTGLCQRYLDAARLHYKLIGVGNQVALRSATVEVTLPGDVIGSWAHGAMETSMLSIEGSRIVCGPGSVPPGRFVELNILFDKASLSNAPVIALNVVDAVFAHEAALQQMADAQRARDARNRVLARYGLLGLLAAFVAVCGARLSGLRRDVGVKKHLAPTEDMDALTGVKAAVAECIYTGSVTINALSGTLLELVQAGVLALIKPDEVCDEVRFELKNRAAASLAPHQGMALEWLFPDSTPLRVSELNAGTNYQRAKAFAEGLSTYQRVAREDASAAGYRTDVGGKRTAWIVLVICVCTGLMIGFGLLGSWWALALCALVAVLLIGCFAQLRNLTDAGERLHAALLGFVENFDVTDEAHLPIAVALGYLEQSMGTTSDVYNEGYVPPYWMYVGWHNDFGRMRRDLQSVHVHNVSVPDPDASSSSSSGGSSGGGGGGGHGAW